MKILVTNNKVLDTIEGKITNITKEYDKELFQTNIIFNIRLDRISKQELCSLYSCKKEEIFYDMPYQSTISKFKQANAPYEEITSEQESNKPIKSNKVSKSPLNKNTIFLRKLLNINTEYNKLVEEVKQELNTGKIENTQELFTKSKSNKELEEIKKQNLIEEIQLQGRYMDADLTKGLDKEGMSAAQLVERAMKTLYDNYRFYYMMLDGLNVKYLDKKEAIEYDCNTMGVSPTTIYFNIDFVLKSTPKELVFLLCHEALHIVLNHHARLLSRNGTLYNIAGDAIINLMLCDEFKCSPNHPSNKAEFPLGGIYYKGFDINIETADSIYDKIVHENPNIINQIEDYYKNLNNAQPNQPQQPQNQNSQQPIEIVEEEVEPELQDQQDSPPMPQGPTKQVKNTNKLYETVQKIFDIMSKIKVQLNDPINAQVKQQAEAKLVSLENKIKEIGKMVDLEKSSKITSRVYAD